MGEPRSHPSVEAPRKTQEFPEPEETPQTQGAVQAAGQIANQAENHGPIGIQDQKEAPTNHPTPGPSVENVGGDVHRNSQDDTPHCAHADLSQTNLPPCRQY